MGIPCRAPISRGPLRRGTILVRRSGRACRYRRLDGLVADRAATGFPGWRVLGILSDAGRKRDWPSIKTALSRCATHFGKLDRLLQGRSFLLGEALSLADITAGTSLYRYFELEIDRPSLPQVERWYRTLQQREAFRTHIMIPFGELFGRLDY